MKNIEDEMELIKKVNQLTLKATESKEGFLEVFTMFVGGIRYHESEEVIMRSIAEKVLPSNYNWDIISTLKGPILLIKNKV